MILDRISQIFSVNIFMKLRNVKSNPYDSYLRGQLITTLGKQIVQQDQRLQISIISDNQFFDCTNFMWKSKLCMVLIAPVMGQCIPPTNTVNVVHLTQQQQVQFSPSQRLADVSHVMDADQGFIFFYIIHNMKIRISNLS